MSPILQSRNVPAMRGVPVAIIVSIDAVLPEKNSGEAWGKLMEIRWKLGKGKQNKKSSVDILSEMRRWSLLLQWMPVFL